METYHFITLLRERITSHWTINFFYKEATAGSFHISDINKLNVDAAHQ